MAVQNYHSGFLLGSFAAIIGHLELAGVGMKEKTPAEQDVSALLLAWSDGDEAALSNLTPIVYEELRRLARYYMGRERSGHSLQATALVNEAYLKLVDCKRMRWENRAHFFAVSAQLMRRIFGRSCSPPQSETRRRRPACGAGRFRCRWSDA